MPTYFATGGVNCFVSGSPEWLTKDRRRGAHPLRPGHHGEVMKCQFQENLGLRSLCGTGSAAFIAGEDRQQ